MSYFDSFEIGPQWIDVKVGYIRYDMNHIAGECMIQRGFTTPSDIGDIFDVFLALFNLIKLLAKAR